MKTLFYYAILKRLKVPHCYKKTKRVAVEDEIAHEWKRSFQEKNARNRLQTIILNKVSVKHQQITLKSAAQYILYLFRFIKCPGDGNYK